MLGTIEDQNAVIALLREELEIENREPSPPSIIEEVGHQLYKYYVKDNSAKPESGFNAWRWDNMARQSLRTLIKQGRESAEWGDYFFDTGSPYTLKKIDKYIRISLSLTETEFEELAE